MDESLDRAQGAGMAIEPLADLLMLWQETGNPATLEDLLQRALPLISRAVQTALRRRGISDPGAADDAISLVLDHLRRLPGTTPGERPVAPFVRLHVPPATGGSEDRGSCFLRVLARDRAIDVARAHDRQARMICRCTNLYHLGEHPPPGRCGGPSRAGGGDDADDTATVRGLLPQLPARHRAIVDLLLEGVSQRIIAHRLNLSEGTVSRIRTRAIGLLRGLVGS